jgi:hypothetical protein
MPASWKLNEYESNLIARRYASGEKVVDIAGAFDVAPWIVSYHAKRWGVTMRKRHRPKRNAYLTDQGKWKT